MNLNLFNDKANNLKENNIIENFIKELSNYLKNAEGRVKNNMSNQTQDNLREENALYQVVGRSLNGIYLQNTKNNKVFEETNISKELLDKLGNDYILRYKNGEYIFEKELTDDFFNSLVDISELN